jgi:pyruvate/2-oxoglutarate dehydrogenase complex dihydrolipoamide acyltransferase (E2) component
MFEINPPVIDNNSDEIIITDILFENNELVETGKILFELETSKTVVEFKAEKKGYYYTKLKLNDTLSINETLVYFDPSNKIHFKKTEEIKNNKSRIIITEKAKEYIKENNVDINQIDLGNKKILKLNDLKEILEKNNKNKNVNLLQKEIINKLYLSKEKFNTANIISKIDIPLKIKLKDESIIDHLILIIKDLLIKNPTLNSRISGNEIIPNKVVNIGLLTEIENQLFILNLNKLNDANINDITIKKNEALKSLIINKKNKEYSEFYSTIISDLEIPNLISQSPILYPSSHTLFGFGGTQKDKENYYKYLNLTYDHNLYNGLFIAKISNELNELIKNYE